MRVSPFSNRYVALRGGGDAIPLGHGDRQRERFATRDLARRFLVKQREVRHLRPLLGAEREKQPARGEARELRLGRDESAREEQGRRRERQGTVDRSRLDHRAEVDGTCLVERLLDRRRAQLGRAEAVVDVLELEELDRARQAVVQAGPAILNPKGDVQIGEADDQRREDVTVRQPAGQSNQRQQQCEPHARVKVSQPVGQARQHDERDDPRDHPAYAVERKQPAHAGTQGLDPRFEL